jgi:hypothetical protein
VTCNSGRNKIFIKNCLHDIQEFSEITLGLVEKLAGKNSASRIVDPLPLKP